MTQMPHNNMETLPKQFVSAMRTLFDIMDDKHTGYVKLTDIENRWRDDRTKGLPRGVIESLQKVTSHDGLLTFDRFCTGLKLCLLRNQVDKSNNADSYESPVESQPCHQQLQISKIQRPPSAPLISSDDTHNRENKWSGVNKNDVIQQQRTSSMPQLLTHKDAAAVQSARHSLIPTNSNGDMPIRIYGPPKPPRLEKSTERKDHNVVYKSDDGHFQVDDGLDVKLSYDAAARIIEEQSRGLGDGRSAVDLPAQVPTVRRGTRRREPRRHTLHNGVDYNLLKRMKQIEQEKDVLMQGLGAVEEAREWYLKQLGEVQEKIRYAGRMGTYVEPWSESQQERLELLRARVTELNRQLGALAAGWRRGPLSLHMNLALPAAPVAPPHATVLRSQNKMLSEEVNRKSEKINALEREKSALIRELLLQRNRSKILDNYN